MERKVNNLDIIRRRISNHKYNLPLLEQTFSSFFPCDGLIEKVSLIGAFFYSAFLSIASAGLPKKITCATDSRIDFWSCPGPTRYTRLPRVKRSLRQLIAKATTADVSYLTHRWISDKGEVENILRCDKRSQSPAMVAAYSPCGSL